MAKTLAFLVGASAIALVGMATAPQPASAGSHVGVDVGPGGVYIGPRHRDYYDEDDYWRRRHHERGAWYEGRRHHERGAWDEGHRRYHDED